MPAPHQTLLVLLLALASAAAARADDEAPASDATADSVKDATGAAEAAPADDDRGEPRRRTARPVASDQQEKRDREELKREVMDEVRRELEKTKSDIRSEVAYVESEADARSYDAEQLRELKQTVNLLQLHGYFRLRGNLYNNFDLNRGVDPSNHTTFPISPGTSQVADANMRLRLNPILRISSGINVYGQIDILDNVLLGGDPLLEPFFDPTTPSGVLTTRERGVPLLVKRLWAEVETPLGQLAFGRMPFHFGEGMVWNDGNCLDCDHGTTFDRVQLTFGPALGGHLFTLAADALFEGLTTNDPPASQSFSNFQQPVDLAQLDDAYRFSLQLTRQLPPAELKRRRDNGEWIFQYGAVAAYRFQHSQPFGFVTGTDTPNIKKIDAQFADVDAYFQTLYRKLRLSTEWAGLFGQIANRPDATTVFDGQSLDFVQWAGIVRGQYAFLKQDSLLAGLDLGIASGDGAPGMGARPGRNGGGPGGSTVRGDLDGPQYACTAAGCSDGSINNFRMNPDFRLDQILWRNLFVSITDTWFARGEVRFKPGGRASGGGDDEGFEFLGSAMYSQALNASSTPGGSTPLGFELDGAVTYTSKDHFFAALIAGILFPLSGFDNPANNNDLDNATAYRAVLGVHF